MVRAFVGIKIGIGESYRDWTVITTARDDIGKINGIKEVHGVYGRFDLIAVIDVETLEEINTLINEQIRAINGVQSTETFITF